MHTVLYVDDEPDLLVLGKLFLEQTGEFSVDVITSAKEALPLLETTNYDAVISDYMMPEMDGIVFLKTVRAAGNQIPFILFTGKGREEVVIRALNEGANFYLQKGGDPNAVFAELANHILQAVQRQKAESAHAESERKYRTVFETANEGIWIIDTEFKTVTANRKMQEIFGYTEPEMLGRQVWEFVPAGEAGSMKEELAKRPRGVPGRYERRWVKKDGTIIWCWTAGTPLFSPDGKFIGSFGMFTDITHRKEMEQALRDSEARFRAIIDQSFQFIGLLKTDGTVIEVNRSALEFSGITASDVLFRPFWETPWWIHSPDQQEKLKDAIQRAASGELVRFEATHPSLGGNLATIDFSIKPARDADGRIQYLIPEGRDITERRKAEDELRAAYEQLTAAEEELRAQLEKLKESKGR